MAWDIYGNTLQRGHCEVHPHVHEEYPCSVCMSERRQAQQPHDALEQLEFELAQQGDYIKHLEAERAALAAQVKEMSQLCLTAAEVRELQAAAGRDGFIAGAAEASDCLEEHAERIYKDEANQYAELVRQGSA